MKKNKRTKDFCLEKDVCTEEEHNLLVSFKSNKRYRDIQSPMLKEFKNFSVKKELKRIWKIW